MKPCVICHKVIGDISGEKVTLGETGCATINSVSKELQDTVHVTVGDFVHKKCRATYTNKKVVQQKLKEKLILYKIKPHFVSNGSNNCT